MKANSKPEDEMTYNRFNSFETTAYNLAQAHAMLLSAWRYLRAQPVADENGAPTDNVAAMDVLINAAVKVRDAWQQTRSAN